VPLCGASKFGTGVAVGVGVGVPGAGLSDDAVPAVASGEAAAAGDADSAGATEADASGDAGAVACDCGFVQPANAPTSAKRTIGTMKRRDWITVHASRSGAISPPFARTAPSPPTAPRRSGAAEDARWPRILV
jgi:hypothetical protein